MFFFCLAVFSLVLWFFPWWSLALVAFVVGMFVREYRGLHVALAGAVAWSALAFLQDGFSHGLISKRMSVLLGLPSSGLLFLLMAVLGAVTAILCAHAGRSLQQIYKRTSKVV